MDRINFMFSGTSPTADGTSISYRYQVSFRSFMWEISKRFSEFESLLEQLPALPPKGIPMMNASSLQISQRTVELGALLERLSGRPDVRQSQPFRTFIAFDAHTNFAIVPHELDRGRTNVDQRFGVVGLSTYADAIVGVHTDTTSLSRLGRVWSIVEADELAQLSIWKLQRVAPADSADLNHVPPLGEKLYSKLLPEKANCMRMNSKGELFLGMGNGTVLGYKLEDPSKPFVTINAHGQSPVVAIEILSDETVLSVGLDGGLRVSSFRTGQVIGGGKLAKRLEPNEVFRCMFLHAESARVFIGTDKGRVFIFDISSGGTPQYLHNLTMSAYPVRAIHANESVLLVGFASFINSYPLVAKGNERELTREFQIQTRNSAGVHSCSTLPHSQEVILAGLSDGSITVYSKTNILYSRYFSEERINVLFFSKQEKVFWAGGDDGRIVEVKIPSTLDEDVKYVSDADQSALSENKKPFKSQIQSNVIGMKLVASDQSRSNPSCLKKSPALAEDDSDDEWRRGLFSN